MRAGRTRGIAASARSRLSRSAASARSAAPPDVRDIESAGRFERGELVRPLSGQHPRARVALAPLDQWPQGRPRRSCSARASVSRGPRAPGNGVAHRETVLRATGRSALKTWLNAGGGRQRRAAPARWPQSTTVDPAGDRPGGARDRRRWRLGAWSSGNLRHAHHSSGRAGENA